MGLITERCELGNFMITLQLDLMHSELLKLTIEYFFLFFFFSFQVELSHVGNEFCLEANICQRAVYINLWSNPALKYTWQCVF